MSAATVQAISPALQRRSISAGVKPEVTTTEGDRHTSPRAKSKSTDESSSQNQPLQQNSALSEMDTPSNFLNSEFNSSEPTTQQRSQSILRNNPQFDSEPNPFEKSFSVPSGGPTASAGLPSTPGGRTILPPVDSMTTPTGLGDLGNYGFGIGSLRHGPLSPAMLQGPTGSYEPFRSGLTPNESGIRTGLTPGGTGTTPGLFLPSPTTAQLLGMSPGTMGALASVNPSGNASFQNTLPAGPTSFPSRLPPGRGSVSGQGGQGQGNNESFGENQAANGLFLLANNAQQQHPPQQINPQSAVGKEDLTKRALTNSLAAKQQFSDQEPPPNKKVEGMSTRSKNQKGGTGRKSNEADVVPQPMQGVEKTSNSANGIAGKKSIKGKTAAETDEEKRKNFLERNRQAALKCRQRKKQWLSNLQTKVEWYGHENELLNQEIATLREEIINLKTLLMAHKDCPVALRNGTNEAAINGIGGGGVYGVVGMGRAVYPQ